VDLYLDQQAIDMTTPMGKLVFQLTGAFAEFERTMIRLRIKAGLKRAVAPGPIPGNLGETIFGGREVAGAEVGWPVLGYLLEKNFGGVTAIISFRQEDGCSSLPCRDVLSFLSEAREGIGMPFVLFVYCQSGNARVGNTPISGRGAGRYIRFDPWSWLSLQRAQA
jgi:Resolvase, N terminal domain